MSLDANKVTSALTHHPKKQKSENSTFKFRPEYIFTSASILGPFRLGRNPTQVLCILAFWNTMMQSDDQRET